MRPSRCAFLRANLRACRIAWDFSRFSRSEGFSYERRCFISRNTPSRCTFFQKTGGLIDTEGLIDIVVAHKNLQSIFLWLEMRRTQAQKVRSSWRERQLVFFGRTLERFRRVLNSINDLVAFLDRYQANDLVQAARGIIPERPFETHALTD